MRLSIVNRKLKLCYIFFWNAKTMLHNGYNKTEDFSNYIK